MNIRITSDSTCDLDPDYLRAHRVEILPLYTMKGNETFRDGVDIVPQDIFDHVAAGGDLCSTAANNVDDYLTRYCLKSGAPKVTISHAGSSLNRSSTISSPLRGTSFFAVLVRFVS